MSARSERIEVITRGERRRRWSVEQKREIAAESLEPGISPITVARRYGIAAACSIRGGGICWKDRSGPVPGRRRSSHELK
jgi:transposase-like protein